MNMMNLRGSLDIARRAVDRCLMLAKLSENVDSSSVYSPFLGLLREGWSPAECRSAPYYGSFDRDCGSIRKLFLTLTLPIQDSGDRRRVGFAHDGVHQKPLSTFAGLRSL